MGLDDALFSGFAFNRMNPFGLSLSKPRVPHRPFDRLRANGSVGSM